MKTSIKTLLFLIINLYSIILIAGDKKATASDEAKARQWMKKQTRYFIENKGQIANSEGKAADNVLFKANFGNCDIYLTTEGISYVFMKLEDRRPKTEERKPRFEDSELAQKHIISYYRMDMKLVGAVINKDSIIKEQQGNQGHYNYFYPHCPDGIYNVNEYAKITIKSIYPGIDWIIYTNTESDSHPLKYDFIIHPQADYRQIRIKYINAQDVYPSIDKSKLNIKTIAGNIEEGSLYCYHPESKAETKSSYHISNDTVVSFQLATYDKSQTIIIDPLVWATYYGENGDDGFESMVIDSYDNIYITGFTESITFPTVLLTGTNWQTNIFAGNNDIILIKFNNQGQRIWATFYGGSDEDHGKSICVDSQNNIIITGYTKSSNIPTKQSIGAYWQPIFGGGTDVFILKIDNQGLRNWATYYGGFDSDFGWAITKDSQDNIILTGNSHVTIYSNFPIQQLSGAYWQSASNATGDFQAFILKFNNLGQILWATFYGGNSFDYGLSICVDNQDTIFTTGITSSNNFPTQQLNGAYWQSNNGGNNYDAYIIKFNSQCQRIWATYYGGSGSDYSYSICSDVYNNIYITGSSNSSNFPLQMQNGAFFQSTRAGELDIIIVKFNNLGQRLWATYYGGNQEDIGNSISTDKQGNIYITGNTLSFDFPTQYLSGSYNQAGFNGGSTIIMKFNKYGIRKWATYFKGFSHDYNNQIAVDNQKYVYYFCNVDTFLPFTLDLGNNAYYDSILNSYDGAIIKFKICHAEPADSAKVSRNNFCASDNGNIKLIAFGGVGDTLKWYKDGCSQHFIGSGDTLIIPSPTNTTTYYALWKSCDTTYSPCVSVTVTVDTATARKPVLLSSSKNNFCSTDSSIIKLSAVGGSGDTLKWYAGSCGQNYQGKGDSIFIPSPQQTTIYYARWESRCDTSACNSITVNVKPTPVVDLGADAFICEGQSINLTVNQSNATFLWQDGSINNYFNIVKPGMYWVNVNQNNCYASDTIQFVLCEPPLNIWIPNAFTPNGDGINDVFRIETINKLQEFRMLIFNRWGQLIFESNNQNKGWDGKCDGTSVQEGVYFWKMEYIWADSYGISKKVEKDGIVTLVK